MRMLASAERESGGKLEQADIDSAIANESQEAAAERKLETQKLYAVEQQRSNVLLRLSNTNVSIASQLERVHGELLVY
jgi:hypothetical protein